MKFTSISMVALSVVVSALAWPIQLDAQSQPLYSVTDLGPAGNPFSQATGLNNYGLVTGVDTASNGSQHAVAWYWGMLTDISRPGLGGVNSAAGAVNKFGQITGVAETSSMDPNSENFCGFGTGRQCVAVLWDFGAMTALPSLGGTNSTFGGINDLGEVAGIAQNGHHDPSCPAKAAVNGTGPLYSDFEAVVWGPSPGQVRELSPLPGDTVGMAFAINDSGEVAGASGTCANSVLPGFAAAPHAVVWDKHGIAHRLPNLGGSAPDTTVLAAGNVAEAINNRGIVAGQATLTDNKTWHPVLWQDGIISDLGVLPGDLVGAALNLNNRGEVVGASISAPGPSTGNPRAFFWRQGVMSDLNTLVPKDSPLYLLTAFAINDSGKIVGFGATSDGELHGFLATPCREDTDACSNDNTDARGETKPRGNLSNSARQTLLRTGLRSH